MIVTEMRSFVEDGAPIMAEGTDISGVRYGSQQRPADDDQYPPLRTEHDHRHTETGSLRLRIRVTAYERGFSSELNIKGSTHGTGCLATRSILAALTSSFVTWSGSSRSATGLRGRC